MDPYHPKRRITLSFAGQNGRDFIAVAFGGDASLRLRLMQEPGAAAKGSALKPDDINVSRSLIRVRQGKGRKDRFTLLSKPLIKKLTEYRELYKPKVWFF